MFSSFLNKRCNKIFLHLFIKIVLYTIYSHSLHVSHGQFHVTLFRDVSRLFLHPNNIYYQEPDFSNSLESYSPTRRQSLNVYHRLINLIFRQFAARTAIVTSLRTYIDIYIRESIQAFISPQLILTFFLLSYHYVYPFGFRFGVRLQALPAINLEYPLITEQAWR